MCSNDTLGNTPFQLISDFFHVNKVGLIQGGGGGGGDWVSIHPPRSLNGDETYIIICVKIQLKISLKLVVI